MIFFAITLPIKLISSLIYCHMTGDSFVLTFEDLNDIFLAIISIIQTTAISHLSTIQQPERSLLVIWVEFFYICLVSIKIMLILQILKLTGPLIKALVVIFKECLKFLIVFTIVLIFAALIGYILF
jgi:hypothetical protein